MKCVLTPEPLALSSDMEVGTHSLHPLHSGVLCFGSPADPGKARPSTTFPHAVRYTSGLFTLSCGKVSDVG